VTAFAKTQLKRGEIMHLRAKFGVGVLLIVLSLVVAVPAFAQGPNEFDENWAYSEFVDCANGGAGEWVDMTGSIHFVESPDVFVVNLQNASGVGEITGDVYRAIGTLQETFVFTDGADTYGITDYFRLIGPGPDNNLYLRFQFHGTYDANGNLTAAVDNVRIECR
jgi:hypothetical protein